MNFVIRLLMLGAFFVPYCNVGIAAETVSEKASASTNKVKRVVKKGVHRLSEKTCIDSDVKCAAAKAGNRIEETKDVIKDKTTETINKAD